MKAPVLAYTYTEVLRTLRKRLREPAPARAQILSGPRQAGIASVAWPSFLLNGLLPNPEAG